MEFFVALRILLLNSIFRILDISHVPKKIQVIIPWTFFYLQEHFL